ncbi:hypothetical protein [Ruegeria sp. Ofav3-42]|uniref:hypothetical protein n=1 Tax=Ruegeria sp. Ofav3-42 TaxID=2917759 RepID=UPI001EF5B772|nr:hypothetical protein [Ruegeria sp. Ofav3-42]MCG7518845.1 hypothetical protein [Ruegeria sp. Ofav3-42]
MTSIYHYDAKTSEFLSEGTARPDPKDGTPLVPGNATLTKPPAKLEGKARVFKDGAWKLVDDLRNTTYWTADGAEHVVKDLGPLPDEALTEKPVLPLYPDRSSARLAMVSWIDGFLEKISGRVPQYERASWPAKAEAARAVKAGTARPDQSAMIKGEADVQDKTATEVADKIIARATQFEAIIARATGLRVKLDDRLEAETDPFKWEEILKGGIAEAKALAISLGVQVD